VGIQHIVLGNRAELGQTNQFFVGQFWIREHAGTVGNFHTDHGDAVLGVAVVTVHIDDIDTFILAQ